MAKALLNYAHKVNADMVSIMTQQEHDISEFFLGSLAQNIIFSFDIPVLTITPKQKK
jgi:nucleotide-binding universal stress UspA family protein